MPVAHKTRLQIVAGDIARAISELPSAVFTHAQIGELLERNREAWHLGQITLAQFIELLIEGGSLQVNRLGFPSRPISRYSWGKASIYDLAQSVNEKGYFSHYTAMALHGLTMQIPKIVYFNIEQNLRPGGSNLSQEGITRAFKGKCRISSNIAKYGDRSICLLNGANTDQLGVSTLKSPETSAKLRVGSIERTLIDATVRPAYSGGIQEVLNAFASAKDKVSINKLVSYLNKIGYGYPYHQAIGFYMARAGYRESQLSLLRKKEIKFDFYLDYGLKVVDYDSNWRIFFPKGL